MKTDWRQFCQNAGFTPLDQGIEVHFESGRSQKVSIEDHEDAFQLSSLVARPSVVAELDDAPLRCWIRTRSVHLVGFRVDARDRLIAEAWLPKAGLTPEEFQFVLRHLAAEADRFEFQLTGRDQE